MARIRQYKKGHRVQLTKNFWSTEFDSKGGYADETYTIIDLDHVEKLQKLRDVVGKSIRITSAYRSPTHNKKVGGATKSRHLKGDATDIQIQGMTSQEIADLAEELDFKGIGIYNTFVHLDSRDGRKARWDFRR
jgi:uncharacterized protein YcbK (DUF882 family)